jgi:hypothetical protein
MRTISNLIATYFQFNDFMELVRESSGTKVTRVNAGPFDYAQGRLFDFAAGEPVCCAQDDSAGEWGDCPAFPSSLYFQGRDSRE